MGWRDSLEQGARDGGHLEADETVEQAIVADSARPIGSGAPELSKGLLKTRFAVIATDRHLYLMEMGAMGYKAVDGVVEKIPIGGARLSSHALGGMVKVGRHGQEPTWELKLSGLRNRPKKLMSYVESRVGSA